MKLKTLSAFVIIGILIFTEIALSKNNSVFNSNSSYSKDFINKVLVQYLLKGNTSVKLEIDGKWGKQSIESLKEYQKNNKLKVTGFINNEVLKKIFSGKKAKNPNSYKINKLLSKDILTKYNIDISYSFEKAKHTYGTDIDYRENKFRWGRCERYYNKKKATLCYWYGGYNPCPFKKGVIGIDHNIPKNSQYNETFKFIICIAFFDLIVDTRALRNKFFKKYGEPDPDYYCSYFIKHDNEYVKLDLEIVTTEGPKKTIVFVKASKIINVYDIKWIIESERRKKKEIENFEF